MLDDVLEFVLNLLPLAGVLLLFGLLAVVGAALWRLFWLLV